MNASGGFLKQPNFIKDVQEMLDNKIDSPFLLAFLVDYYEAQLDQDSNLDHLDQASQVFRNFLYSFKFLSGFDFLRAAENILNLN